MYVKGTARSDEPTDSYHPIVQFPSAGRRVSACISSLFWF